MKPTMQMPPCTVNEELGSSNEESFTEWVSCAQLSKYNLPASSSELKITSCAPTDGNSSKLMANEPESGSYLDNSGHELELSPLTVEVQTTPCAPTDDNSSELLADEQSYVDNTVLELGLSTKLQSSPCTPTDGNCAGSLSSSHDKNLPSSRSRPKPGLKRKKRYRRCPILGCNSKPQKRLADHIRLCHQNITPRRRNRFCQIAERVQKRNVRQCVGQRKLNFTPQTPSDEFSPIFQPSSSPLLDRKKERREDLTPGRKGTTRNMGSFSSTNPKISDFIRYLTSVEGGMRSESTARDLAVDVSKILYYCHPKSVSWGSLLDTKTILSFFEHIRAAQISPSGRLTKMERLGDALKYMRFCSRANKSPSPRLDEIKALEESLAKWKTLLHREKRRISASRLERSSNELPALDSINDVINSTELEEEFNEVVKDIQLKREVTGERMRFAVAALCVPLMYSSSSRPGALVHFTTAEFKEGRMVDDLFIATAYEHKTNMIGPCKLVFDKTVHKRAIKYMEYIRPKLVEEHGDIPEFFVLPGSKPIDKMSNLTRVIQKNLKLEHMPTATEVRKMASTTVAKKCPAITRDLIARQFNHDPKVSAQHYQATIGDKDSAMAFKTLKSLRIEDGEGDEVTNLEDEVLESVRVSDRFCRMKIN